MKKKLRIWIVVILKLCAVLGIVIALNVHKNKNKDKSASDTETIVKDNVIVLDPEDENQPIEISENELRYKKDPELKKDDVIVSGITKLEENGFIRKVTEVKQDNDVYVVNTEPACLTDVFERAHIVKKFVLTEDGMSEMDEVQTETSAGAVWKTNAVTTAAIKTVIPLSDEKEDEEDSYLFETSFSEKEDEITVSGKAGFDVEIGVQIDIEHGDITCGIAAHTKAGAELSAEESEELKKEFEKTIFEKKLPNYQFVVAGIPIVMTNDLKGTFRVEGKVGGSITTSYKATAESTLGFSYESKSGEVEKIKTMEAASDGLQWKTETKISGSCAGEVLIHIVTKLYGSTGMDIAGGIIGEAKGEAKLTTKPDLTGVAGSVELSLSPKIKGNLVVTVPVIDKSLVDQELFDKTLKPFWSHKWESSKDWKNDLLWDEKSETENDTSAEDTNNVLNGDFSEFAGTYKATDNSNNLYGGGLPLRDLELHADGAISGGGTSDNYDMYPNTKPKSITKNEDGSYLCVLTDASDGVENKYYIYPEGTAQEDVSDQDYLVENVYIRCIQIDGGVGDIIYYKEKIKDTTPAVNGKKTYTTKADAIPSISMDYPESWHVDSEDIDRDYEWDVLKNQRGVQITYYLSNTGFGSQYYGGGQILLDAHITKAADTSFQPQDSDLGKFVVAKIKVYAENGTEYDGDTFYAVVPESYLGDDEFCGTGYWAMCSFTYQRYMLILAEAPDGVFTSEEEAEVIQTLSSLRVE